MTHRAAHPREIIALTNDQFLPMDVATDAEGLYAALVRPAVGSEENAQLQIYIAALRQDRDEKRIRDVFWLPTKEMPAYRAANCRMSLPLTGWSFTPTISGMG